MSGDAWQTERMAQRHLPGKHVPRRLPANPQRVGQFAEAWALGYRRGRSDEQQHKPDATATHVFTPPHHEVEISGIMVDEGIRDLLLALWKLGLQTQFSCQGHPDRFNPYSENMGEYAAQILFANMEHGFKFVKKSLELLNINPEADDYLERSLFHTGGFDIRISDGMWPDPTFRADVRFSPLIIPELTRLWTEFEKTVPKAE